jgi:hypothetical protein
VCLLWSGFACRSSERSHGLRVSASQPEYGLHMFTRNIETININILVEAAAIGCLLYRSLNKINQTTAFLDRIPGMLHIEASRRCPQRDTEVHQHHFVSMHFYRHAHNSAVTGRANKLAVQSNFQHVASHGERSSKFLGHRTRSATVQQA